MRSTPPAVPAETAPGLRMGVLAAVCAGGLLGTALQLQQRELAAPSTLWAVLAALISASMLAWAALITLRVRRRGTAARAEPAATAATAATAAQMAPAALGGPQVPRIAQRNALRDALCVAAWLLVALVAAFVVVSLRAHARLAERLPAALEGRDIVVTGTVAQLPRTGLQGTRFLFAVEAASLDGAPVSLPPTLSLGWYRFAEPDALLLGPQAEVRAGQRWRFTVRLRQPHGSFNPGGFDLELWLFERGIGATGSVRSQAGDTAALLAEAAAAPIERLRQRVRDSIERRISGPGQGGIAGVLAALAIGDQAAIERDDWELFRITGVAHLMSISGLHVTMFAWLAGGVIGWLWRRSARAMTWLPAPLAARWGGVAVALAYAAVAGWGVPAQRTVWMLATIAALHSLGARWPLHLVLLLVAWVVVAVDPWALLQPGFWLSFVAVGLLAASAPAGAAGGAPPQSTLRQRAVAVAKAALHTQFIATLGLAPLSLVFFQQISLVGFAANLVAIPVVTLLVTPLALLGTLAPALWDAAAFVLWALMAALQWLAGGAHALVPAVWQAAAAPGWAMAAGLLGGIVAVLPLPFRLRALALPLMLPLLAPPVPRPAEGHFEFVALDVGQGTAALIRTRRHLLVYDAGPAFSPDSDAGSRLVVPLLRRRGEAHIDHLVLSHRDTDHVGGAAALVAALPVRQLSSSLHETHPLLAQARAAGAALRRCEAGQHWVWDGVRFEFLHPVAADFALPGLKPNALSCVLRVSAAPTGSPGSGVAGVSGRSSVSSRSSLSSVLLTGDIEAAQEAALLARDAGSLRAAVLLVPHHGSRTSSTPAFVDTVAPEMAIVQAAYRSRFGHPAPDVVARYEARGAALVRSDRCGAFTLRSAAGAHCEREAARRYWHHRSPAREPG